MLNSTDLKAVRGVLARHKTALLSKYHATGIGVGKAEGAATGYVIVVYLDGKERKPAETVVVEGIPVRFEVTGSFYPLTRKEDPE